MCKANRKYLALRYGCGIGRMIPQDCGDPLCIECERNRARDRQKKWLPVLESMKSPRMLTLTIKNGSDLAERIRLLQVSFRHLLDLRIGARNLAGLKHEAMQWLTGHLVKLYEAGEITEIESSSRWRQWESSLERFENDVRLYHAKKNKWPRMRDLIGRGFATLEITRGNDGWHPHRHLVSDGRFIPWPLLVVGWIRATDGAGEIVDIRAMGKTQKDIKEAAKYVTKAWQIPEEYHAEFRQAIRGLKRVWPLGGATPAEIETICPFCGDPACHARMLGIGEEFERGKVGESDLVILRMAPREFMAFIKSPDGWRSIPLDLIPKDFACHSEMNRGP